MKRTILSVALTSILAACGAGSDAQPVAPEQQEQHQQVTPVAPEQQPEPQRIDPIKESEYLDPMSQQAGLPFEAPKAEEEQPIGDWEAKYLNTGVARAIIEYKMVGESLKAELAAEMGEGFDAWIKKDVERCVADTEPTLKNPELRLYWAKVVCTGQAYGYWALVNGTAGTEGTPRQCFEQGKCGFMFRQYDLSASEPLVNPMSGIDNSF